MLVLINFVVLLGWYFWTNVRPKLIYAACSDVAHKTSLASNRYNLNVDSDQKFVQERDNCLNSATAGK